MKGFSFVLSMNKTFFKSYIIPSLELILHNIALNYSMLIGLVGRVFANGPGDLGSIPGRVIPKNFKMVLDASLLNTQQYKVASRVKWSNPGRGVAPFPTPWCSSYRELSGRPRLRSPNFLYFTYSMLVTTCVKHVIISML